MPWNYQADEKAQNDLGASTSPTLFHHTLSGLPSQACVLPDMPCTNAYRIWYTCNILELLEWLVCVLLDMPCTVVNRKHATNKHAYGPIKLSLSVKEPMLLPYQLSMSG
jgi:hypothetical protein